MVLLERAVDRVGCVLLEALKAVGGATFCRRRRHRLIECDGSGREREGEGDGAKGGGRRRGEDGRGKEQLGRSGR